MWGERCPVEHSLEKGAIAGDWEQQDSATGIHQPSASPNPGSPLSQKLQTTKRSRFGIQIESSSNALISSEGSYWQRQHNLNLISKSSGDPTAIFPSFLPSFPSLPPSFLSFLPFPGSQLAAQAGLELTVFLSRLRLQVKQTEVGKMGVFRGHWPSSSWVLKSCRMETRGTVVQATVV